jgi:hypothetical protein
MHEKAGHNPLEIGNDNVLYHSLSGLASPQVHCVDCRNPFISEFLSGNFLGRNPQGLDAKELSPAPAEGELFSLDISFYRTRQTVRAKITLRNLYNRRRRVGIRNSTLASVEQRMDRPLILGLFLNLDRAG